MTTQTAAAELASRVDLFTEDEIRTTLQRTQNRFVRNDAVLSQKLSTSGLFVIISLRMTSPNLSASDRSNNPIASVHVSISKAQQPSQRVIQDALSTLRTQALQWQAGQPTVVASLMYEDDSVASGPPSIHQMFTTWRQNSAIPPSFPEQSRSANHQLPTNSHPPAHQGFTVQVDEPDQRRGDTQAWIGATMRPTFPAPPSHFSGSLHLSDSSAGSQEEHSSLSQPHSRPFQVPFETHSQGLSRHSHSLSLDHQSRGSGGISHRSLTNHYSHNQSSLDGLEAQNESSAPPHGVRSSQDNRLSRHSNEKDYNGSELHSQSTPEWSSAGSRHSGDFANRRSSSSRNPVSTNLNRSGGGPGNHSEPASLHSGSGVSSTGALYSSRGGGANQSVPATFGSAQLQRGYPRTEVPGQQNYPVDSQVQAQVPGHFTSVADQRHPGANQYQHPSQRNIHPSVYNPAAVTSARYPPGFYPPGSSNLGMTFQGPPNYPRSMHGHSSEPSSGEGHSSNYNRPSGQ